MTPLEYRVLPCLALDELQPVYLVQCRLRGGGRWLNVCDADKACLFRERLEAEIYIDFQRCLDAEPKERSP